jgi:RNA polymerase sigma-70 factor (ECF subfamily)
VRPDTGPVLGSAFATSLADAQAGSQDAFAVIFRDVQPVLLRYLLLIAPDATDDVASETWLNVVSGLADFRGDERSFRAWLFTIARHRAADWGRGRARRHTVPLADSGAEELLASPDTADVVLERAATRAALTMIATLPADQAEIIMLRVVAGLDNAHVGRIVGKTPGAVRVTAHRALRRLAELADRAGVTL